MHVLLIHGRLQPHLHTRRLAKTIEDFAVIVLLPLYFAASGLKTEVQLGTG